MRLPPSTITPRLRAPPPADDGTDAGAGAIGAPGAVCAGADADADGAAAAAAIGPAGSTRDAGMCRNRARSSCRSPMSSSHSHTNSGQVT
eukprot:1157871-Pelagomonas_calceolata.AAC.8